MKSLKTRIAIALIMLIGLTFAGTAAAQDVVLKDKQIKSVTVQPDKNGNDYARIIFTEPRELNGVRYEAEVLAMCFGTTVEAAKTLSAGDMLNAVAQTGMYNGNTNYRVLQFISQ